MSCFLLVCKRVMSGMFAALIGTSLHWPQRVKTMSPVSEQLHLSQLFSVRHLVVPSCLLWISLHLICYWAVAVHKYPIASKSSTKLSFKKLHWYFFFASCIVYFCFKALNLHNANFLSNLNFWDPTPIEMNRQAADNTWMTWITYYISWQGPLYNKALIKEPVTWH